MWDYAFHSIAAGGFAGFPSLSSFSQYNLRSLQQLCEFNVSGPQIDRLGYLKGSQHVNLECPLVVSVRFHETKDALKLTSRPDETSKFEDSRRGNQSFRIGI